MGVLDDWSEARRLADIAASYFDSADDEEFYRNFSMDVQRAFDAALAEARREERERCASVFVPTPDIPSGWLPGVLAGIRAMRKTIRALDGEGE